MAKYCYNVVDKYVNRTNNLEDLFKMILSDPKGVEEFKENRNIIGVENIKREVRLVLDSYPELQTRFQGQLY